jgi:hypothetical protein
LHRDSTKEKAIRDIARMSGVSMDEVLAVGDDLNDIGMLKAAGVGVAVGNALDCVKAIADYVCEQDNYKGVIESIKRFCFMEKANYEQEESCTDGADLQHS